jgi:uncharacterized membrane protein (UPF0136 family)
VKTNYFFQSALSFGVLLVMIGIVGYYKEWTQAPVFILLGLLFELLAALVYIWNKIKK